MTVRQDERRDVVLLQLPQIRNLPIFTPRSSGSGKHHTGIDQEWAVSPQAIDHHVHAELALNTAQRDQLHGRISHV